MLSNGRASYILFEELVRELSGLQKAKNSDHHDALDRMYEQKAYADHLEFPHLKYDYFQTSASSTFPANNFGPKIKALLEAKNYDGALKICQETGYSKNDFYIYTNTSGFTLKSDFKYFIIPTENVLQNLHAGDPRLVSRSKLLALITAEMQIS